MKRMVRLKVETFDLAAEQGKPESYNREFNKQSVLEVCTELVCASVLIEHLQVALKPRIEPNGDAHD